MKSSLRTAFAGIWLFVLVTCIALGVLMQGLYRLGVDARVDTVAAKVTKAATVLQSRFAGYRTSYATPPDFTDAQRRRELGLILDVVLDDFEDVEGGFFAASDGFLAYAFPSYEGSTAKRDVPEAESARIAAIARDALAAGHLSVQRVAGARQVLLLAAAPVAAGTAPIAVWVMSRAHVRTDDGSRRLLAGLVTLGGFVLLSGIVLMVILRRWTLALGRLDTSLATAPADGPLAIEATGHRDLDRVATMVSALYARLAERRAEGRRLEAELARANRVSTIGRMSAQLVHEIRNPIAAMRLRAENALAGAGEPRAALGHVLRDVHRLDDLLERMQALTRLGSLMPRPVHLDGWLADSIAPFIEQARSQGAAVSSSGPPSEWPIDAAQMTRAIGNLVINALQHVPTVGGRVEVRARVDDDPRSCRIHVVDNGFGIDDSAREDIFEAFQTTRAAGTGLGLSIAREIVEAHGGTLRALSRSESEPWFPADVGAVFLIELPWAAS